MKTNRVMFTFKPGQYDIEKLIESINSYDTIKEAYYILHNKDEEIEEHYHFALYTITQYDLEYWTKNFLSDIVPQNQLEVWDTWKKCKAYLTHKLTSEVDKGKYLYSDSEVITIKGNAYQQEIVENKGKSSELDRIIELIENDELKPYNMSDYIDTKTYVKYKSQIQDAYSFHLNKLAKERKDREMEVYYFYGPAGTGKTTFAKYMAQSMGDSGIYVCDGGKNPFDSYGGESNIIFDDFRDDTMTLQEFLKLCDNHTSSNVRARYYNKNLSYCKRMFITTNISPKEIFKTATAVEDRNQIYRRIQVFHFRYLATDTSRRNVIVEVQEYNAQFGFLTSQTFNLNLDALLLTTKVLTNTNEKLIKAFKDTINSLSPEDKKEIVESVTKEILEKKE